MIIQDYYDIIQQPSRDLYIKIFLLNSSFKKIGELEGICLSGNINIDVNSDIRRTCNVELIIKDSSFLVGKDKKIWLDKFINIQIGLKNLRTQEIEWWNQGFFIINQPSINYSSKNNTLSFEGIDCMAKLTGQRDGVLTSKTVILENTPLHEAIKMTVKTLGGFSNVIVENTNRVVPYKNEKQAGDSIYSLLSELRDLYMDWEIYFDINGNFHYEKIRNKLSDTLALDFTQLYRDLILDVNYNYDFENVKNKITINGRQLDNGTQVTYVAINNDVNSPFNINTDIGTIEDVINDDKIFNIEQAQARGEYELLKHNNLKETLSLSIVPIYFLKGNDKVKYRNKKLEIDGEFLIQSLNIPLDINSSMQISAIKLY